jgi:hypothetical protein
MERYYCRGSSNFSLKREHFEEDRYYDLQPGDTFWQGLEDCTSSKDVFSSALYRGDKIPLLYKHLDKLFDEMEDAKVLYIVRDIYEVAASYNVRAKDEDDGLWRRDQDYNAAIKDWNESLTCLYRTYQKSAYHLRTALTSRSALEQIQT